MFCTHGLDAIGVVDCKLGVVGSLDSFVDDAVDDAQGVEVKLDALLGSIGNLLVLSVEVVEELLWLVPCIYHLGRSIGLQQGHSV